MPQMGWAGIKNGDLMKLAESTFDVFITVDRNLSFQQNLSQYSINVIVLKAVSNRYEDLRPFAPLILSMIPKLEPGKATVLHL